MKTNNHAESLSDKIFLIKGNVPFYHLKVEDVKEFIQNSERRIKEVINMDWRQGMHHILKEVENIFKDEAGEELANHSPQKDRKTKLKSALPTSEDTKKGCGIIFDEDLMGKDYEDYNRCGDNGNLCPKCSGAKDE